VSGWLQISVVVAQPAVKRAAEVMEGLGAIAVSRESTAVKEFFDEARSKDPEWDEEKITGLFAADTDLSVVCGHLKAVLGHQTNPCVQALPDRDWELAGQEQFKPIHIRDNLWVCPSWCQPEDPDAINLMIDPGLAFGSGTHPTTCLCLEHLTGLNLNGSTVLDWGCGSGIQALAALRLGASKAIGVDIDPIALDTSRNNAERNGVGSRLRLMFPEQVPSRLLCDVLIANILAHTLIDLAPTLEQHLSKCGTLMLSGLLEGQAERVLSAFGSRYTFKAEQRDEWVLLIAVSGV
jgi:ribosomal protein L11 methyltransferase